MLRSPRHSPTIKWKFNIPIELAARIDILCLREADRLYGARSEIIRMALIEYLDRRGIGLELVAPPPINPKPESPQS